MSARPQSLEAMRALIRGTELGDTPSSMRAGFASIMRGQPDGEPGEVGGVPGLYVGVGDLQALWFHGGGYVFGSAATHTFAASRVADALGGRIFLPDYPLAPEHVWPAQRDAGLAVLDALEGPIAVIGDSSGGHLALQLALAVPDKISKLVLFSPNTDRSGLSSTRESHSESDLMNTDAKDRELFETSCPGANPNDTDASPVLADLSKLPPTCLAVGGAEVLLDDTLLLARALGLADVRTELHVLPGQSHMFWQWPDLLPPANRALMTAGAFITRA